MSMYRIANFTVLILLNDNEKTLKIPDFLCNDNGGDYNDCPNCICKTT